MNPDVVGWIEVPGTSISQPVVKAPGEDPTYYLSHDVYRERNFWGCPYVDAGCKAGLSSWNAVIFGHNISYPPAMFHELEGYRSGQFAAEHAEVVLHTPSCTRRLAVAGADTVPGWEHAKRVEFAGAAQSRPRLPFACWVGLAFVVAVGKPKPTGLHHAPVWRRLDRSASRRRSYAFTVTDLAADHAP